MPRWQVVVAVFALMGLGGCSDDNGDQDSRPPDAGVDMPINQDIKVDQPVAKEGGQDQAQPDAGPTYSALISAAEVTGRATWGPPKPDAGPPTRLLSVAATFDKPSATIKPDFVDSPKPPNCVAYKWSSGGAPNRSAGDAGKVTITGHDQALYVDGDNPGTPVQLPATIECNRVEIATSGLFIYNCGLPTNTVLPVSSWLTDTTKIGVTVAGGTDITAFSVTDVATGPIVVPKSTFDLNQLDPAAITAEWETTTAPLVAINISASLKSGAESALITCTTLGVAGSKQIPAGALALLPTPTATDPLILRTSIVGFNTKGTTAAWGSYLAGVGRGAFGISCRTPAGQCP